ncbi:MAG: hypothetical protein WC683_06200 [bacterium]
MTLPASDIPDRMPQWGSDGTYYSTMSDDEVATGFVPDTASVSAQEMNWALRQLSRGLRWTRDLPLQVGFGSTGWADTDDPPEQHRITCCQDGIVWASGAAPTITLPGPPGRDRTLTTTETAVAGSLDDCFFATANAATFRVYTPNKENGYADWAAGAAAGSVTSGSAISVPTCVASCRASGSTRQVFWFFADGSAQKLVRLTWAVSTQTLSATTRTSPVSYAPGVMLMHEYGGVLVAIYTNPGTGVSYLRSSADAGSTWSTEVDLDAQGVQGIAALSYSVRNAEWILVDGFAHIWTTTTPTGTWTRQSVSIPGDDTNPLCSEPVGFVSAAIVESTIVVAAKIGASGEWYLLWTNDRWLTASRIPGVCRVYDGGRKLIYAVPANIDPQVDGGLLCPSMGDVRINDQMPLGWTGY